MKKAKVSMLLLSLLGAPVMATDDTAAFSVGVANWAVLDDFNRFALHLDYQFKPQENWWGLQPRFLLIAAERDQQFFAFGAQKAFDINADWTWGFASHIGYFHNPGGLGYDLEFYSYAFAKYKMSHHHRLKAEFGHISNAGFGDHNPGSESLVISYSYHF